MTDNNNRAEIYQRQMQEQYEVTAKFRSDESEARIRHESYPIDAAAEFKRQYWPADPFDGVLVDASYLGVAELAALYKAAHVLNSQGNEIFANDLILVRCNSQQTMVRINHLWIDASRQRKLEICQLLANFYWGTAGSCRDKRQEILDMGDDQLVEMVQQVEKALNLTAQQLEAIVGES